MRTALATCLLLIIFILSWTAPLLAQEEQTTIHYSKKYIDLNVRTLEKYPKRIERQQTKLLNKLSRKEKILARQLKQKDSAAYVRL